MEEFRRCNCTRELRDPEKQREEPKYFHLQMTQQDAPNATRLSQPHPRNTMTSDTVRASPNQSNSSPQTPLRHGSDAEITPSSTQSGVNKQKGVRLSMENQQSQDGPGKPFLNFSQCRRSL
ncbi:hypothetical protein SKAU_G00184190 [Synaphobranchus kaupii]|uniref:Uncharacterized protein n=1 Tax=Synaphobranchus kaupii TaxID=118154 RepID=A0A9Q1FCP3_SYNKA|nr:hypothetical protein SKAU_G00184190 [Synaphobranchus kaupii]